MSSRTLLGVPNVSEGRSAETIEAIAAAVATPLDDSVPPRLLDVHSDPDHNRSVFTFAGDANAVADAIFRCASETLARVDLRAADPPGQHPHVGALDVAPLVYLTPDDQGQACAHALALADRLGHELELPVFLYGELTSAADKPPRTRADLRRDGLAELTRRIKLPPEDPDSLRPDFGPHEPRPDTGATLLAARPPLVAFNLQLAPPATIEDARRIAAQIREGGERGMPGVRAIAIALTNGVAQVSTNVENPFELPLAAVVAAVAAHAPVATAELVGLVPAAAMEDFPEEVPLPGFDPDRHVIENALIS
jgi:glutamate formiminotransferase / 5-formyltetrahydrofolate cyclo-ligase